MSDGNQGYQSLALETVLNNLLGRKNLLPTKDWNSPAKLLCHREGPGCLGVVLLGTGHDLNKLNERPEVHPYPILSESAPLTLTLGSGLLPSHHWVESSLCPFGVHGIPFRGSSGSTELQKHFLGHYSCAYPDVLGALAFGCNPEVLLSSLFSGFLLLGRFRDVLLGPEFPV